MIKIVGCTNCSPYALQFSGITHSHLTRSPQLANSSQNISSPPPFNPLLAATNLTLNVDQPVQSPPRQFPSLGTVFEYGSPTTKMQDSKDPIEVAASSERVQQIQSPTLAAPAISESVGQSPQCGHSPQVGQVGQLGQLGQVGSGQAGVHLSATRHQLACVILRLYSTNPCEFSRYLRAVLERQSIQSLVDTLHALTGCCMDPGLSALVFPLSTLTSFQIL